MKARITYEEAAKLLELRNGIFYWKPATLGNRVKGAKAGGINKGTGALVIEICNKGYQANHLVWLFSNRRHPDYTLEHINGDKQDVRIENLREVIPNSTKLTYKLVRDIFSYVNGHLIWRNKPTPRSQIKIGKIAGAISKQKYSEYRYIKIGGLKYKAANLVWLYHKGFLPTMMLDHINHISTDDRIENLREVTNRENARNQNLRITNKSGVPGVGKQHGKWTAKISTNTGEIFLGTFSTFDEAVAARKGAEIMYGYHPNHGKRAA